MLRYLTAGESHGKGIVAVLEGMPAGLRLDPAAINCELRRRQSGFGRGKRMQLENDKVEILSGLRKGITLGSPIAAFVKNKDFRIDRLAMVVSPRGGHADLAGLLKYGFSDIRDVLERASARSTVATVIIGALCKVLLDKFAIKISSRVLLIGGEVTKQAMKEKIKAAIDKKDTAGGIFEVIARGVPAGLGSYVHPDRRLDGRLAGGIMSIPGIKAVESGLGFGYAFYLGSQVHDAVYHSKARGYFRKSNSAGGIEGGVSNGEDIILRACMKPISTLMKPLDSVNIITGRPARAATERSDTCVVEAAGVVAESACAFVLAEAFLEKFGGDNLPDIGRAYQVYKKRIA